MNNMNNLNNKNISLKDKIKQFELKLLTYIDIYNITYTNIYENSSDNSSDNGSENYNYDDTDNNIIKYYNIKLEKIGNIAAIYSNFSNITKYLENKLVYSIHKLNFMNLLSTLQFILQQKGHYLHFINYNYELFKVIGISIDNMYIIQQKEKYRKGINNLDINFEKYCKIFIFIKDKLFIYNY